MATVFLRKLLQLHFTTVIKHSLYKKNNSWYLDQQHKRVFEPTQQIIAYEFTSHRATESIVDQNLRRRIPESFADQKE